ncbi:MAG: FliI/YscN family ATPase [Alphaproteobacteria bacterium]|nr:FliI/YscN family ATPase [Alphaproteobacteria bacterium]MDE2341392.1 FliI/YscN family ATPase [Alphaproteobacteria bacterium]
MSGRLLQSARNALDGLSALSGAPRHVGSVTAYDGQMIEVEAFPLPIGSACRMVMADGSTVRGQLVGFRGTQSLVVPFRQDAAFVMHGPVYPDGKGSFAEVGDDLLGRVIDAHGSPLDGRSNPKARLLWPLAGRNANPLDTGRVTQALETGVRAIDTLLTLGEGQRVALVAGSGVGKSVLMGQILHGLKADVYVIGLIGERSREVRDFVETKLPDSRRNKTVVVAVPADFPAQLRLRAAYRATAIAEFFRNKGLRVVLMIDSLTRIAHAQREIGLALGEPPTMKGYPPSALAMIPRLIERGGIDTVRGGSITALYTVLADGGDTNDPVVDTARAITDGHIILSRQMAEQGIYPAIDISKSLSRTMSDTVDDEHLSAAMRFRRLWSVYEDNRDLLLIGGYTKGQDAEVDAAISTYPEMCAFISQYQQNSFNFAESRAYLTRVFRHG